MTDVYTIGYEGTDIQHFIEALKGACIEIVVDVRAVAISRKKGFSKRALSGHLALAGIEYLHLVQLGDPKPGRDAARAGHYDEFRKIYKRYLAGSSPQAQLIELATIVCGKTTCLMCFERDPTACHRSIVASSLPIAHTRIVNLYGDMPSYHVRQPAQVTRCSSRQSAPAAE
ncbi:MAG: DUF488 domain-containing protein [Methylacidiphilales bacterium]|nr:DUF488 domain-containing protein [Candidatus Methylacidiphilales bacterium]